MKLKKSGYRYVLNNVTEEKPGKCHKSDSQKRQNSYLLYEPSDQTQKKIIKEKQIKR